MKLAFIAVVGLLSLSAGAQAQTTIYSNDFTNGAGAFTGTGVAAVTPNGEHYLELFNSNSASISVNTSGYTGLMASFNLYGIESVDGNGPAGNGPDPFLIYINGSATPTYNINIANFGGGNTQSYNGNLAQSGAGNMYAPGTGAISAGNLGYGTGSFGDSTYLVSFALPNIAITSLTFVGATNEAPSNSNGTTGGNEAYGIDNFTLKGTAVPVAVGAVPEPATWAMMILGFGAVGYGMRRVRAKSEAKFDNRIKRIASGEFAI